MDAPTKALNTEKAKALQAALAQIEKQFGKGQVYMDVCSDVSLSPSTNQIQRQGTSETCIECSKDEKRNKKVNVRKELLECVGMVTCVL